MLVVIAVVLLREDIGHWWQCSMTGNGRDVQDAAELALRKFSVCR